MRYQLLEVISLLFFLFFFPQLVRLLCARACFVSPSVCLCCLFLIEKCLLMSSPSVKWGAAWPQIIMTFAGCFLPECHSVTENTACKKKKRKKGSVATLSKESKCITWECCAIIYGIDSECVRTHFFFTYFPSALPSLFPFPAAGVKDNAFAWH